MAEHGLSLEEAYALNTADLKDRRKYAGEYLDALGAHPLNADMTAEQREESATYYGSMHREAMEQFVGAPFPEMDLSDHEALKKIGFGPSIYQVANSFSVDLTQDSQSLFLGKYPEVRAAYVDALGGPESYARYHAQLNLMQAVGTMGQAAAEPVNPYSPLRNKAFAKFELERINETMKGKRISEMPDGLAHRIGESAVSLISSPLPAEGAPTDQQLQDYLDGKIPSPFSNEYVSRVDAQLNTKMAASSRETVQKSVANAIRDKLEFKAAVYDLPYIPAGPDAPRPRPDYYAMSGKDLHDTHVTFDRIFGAMLNAQSNGQLRLAAMKGEEIHDRFRIDGKKVSEIPELQDSKNSRTPEEFRIIMESEILQAMADPKRKVEYVPLSVSENGAPREEAPVEISKATLTLDKGNFVKEPIQEVNTPAAREVLGLTMGFGQLSCQVTTVDGLREGKYFDPLRATSIMDDRTLIPEPGEDDFTDEDMQIGTGKFTSHNHLGGYSVYRTIRGLKKDGTLTKEGENNLRRLKDNMNEQYRQMYDLAAEWDAKDPMLAEMIRMSADGAATSDTAPTWFDLSKSYSYRNISSQLGTIHLGQPGPDHPMNQIEAMQALQGYPQGAPVFPLPHALSAAHRQALAESRHAGSQEAGTLSRMQDRLTRRMMLAEMDQVEKHLRRIDELDRKSGDLNNPEAMQVAYFDRFLDNSVHDASSYYARGTKYVHSDMNGRRALMAQGWPVDDLNLLAYLYMRRDATRDSMNNPNYTEETREQSRRANKVLNEICDYLEKTEIRNEQDREKALAHINSYGDLLYNPTAMGGAGNAVDYQQRFAEMRAKKPLAHEFLSDEERREYRESYERFKAQAESATLTPTVNGPQTDMERAFLNVENIAVLAEAQGQMEADPEIAKRQNIRMIYAEDLMERLE
ncbi:MAG: hypothetical protein IK096_01395, partial [Lachnospiraceae bacterium]|nr:hypothetical protein [Lachnospiraceae bacterium]